MMLMQMASPCHNNRITQSYWVSDGAAAAANGNDVNISLSGTCKGDIYVV
jgi:hypothetical protein